MVLAVRVLVITIMLNFFKIAATISQDMIYREIILLYTIFTTLIIFYSLFLP